MTVDCHIGARQAMWSAQGLMLLGHLCPTLAGLAYRAFHWVNGGTTVRVTSEEIKRGRQFIKNARATQVSIGLQLLLTQHSR